MIIVIVMVLLYNSLLPQLILDQYGDEMILNKKSTCEKTVCRSERGDETKRENKNTECTQL